MADVDAYTVQLAEPRVIQRGVMLRRAWRTRLIFTPAVGHPEALWLA
jgi:hypothetical protein